jgi:hypothetical protein
MNEKSNRERNEEVVLKKKVKGKRNIVVVLIAPCAVLLLIVVSTVYASQVMGWPPAKARLLAQEQQEIATAQAKHRPKPTPHAPPAQPAPTRVAGIANMHQGPFPSSQFSVENFWQGPVGSIWELVYSGTKENMEGNGGIGALAIYNEAVNSTGGFDITHIGTYTVSSGARSLTIISVNGDIIQLRTDTGSILFFDLQTDAYETQ